MTDHIFHGPLSKGLPTDAAREAATRILAGPHLARLPGGGGGTSYATISGTVELTDDPDGSFHRVIYDLYMGSTPHHPNRARNGSSPDSDPGTSTPRPSDSPRALTRDAVDGSDDRPGGMFA